MRQSKYSFNRFKQPRSRARLRRAGRVLAHLALWAAILLLLLNFALQYLLPLTYVKAKIEAFIAAQTQTTVSIDHISANLLGAKLGGLHMMDAHGDPLINIRHARVRLASLWLLLGRVKVRAIHVDRLEVEIVARQDGSLNIQGLLGDEEEQPAPAAPGDGQLPIKISGLHLEEASFSYYDEPTKTLFEAKNIKTEVKDFSAVAPFTIELDGEFSLTSPDINLQTSASLQASVNGMEAADIALTLNLRRTVVNGFKLPDAALNLKARADLSDGVARVEAADLTFPNSQISLSGDILALSPAPLFDFNIDGDISLNAFHGLSAGRLVAKLNIKHDNLAGTAQITGGAGQIGAIGRVEDFNLSLIAQSINDIKAQAAIKNVDMHYLSGQNIKFKADVGGFYPDMRQITGYAQLHTQDGRIKDIYRLTDANAVSKVLFMSLNIVSRVFNVLDVFGTLKSIGHAAAGVVHPGKDKPANDSAGIDYDLFDTRVDFKAGKSTIKHADFVSDQFSVTVSGGVDFNTQIINMHAQAAPGRVTSKGIMPISIKISGTLDKPEGEMQILSSAAHLVSDTVLHNPASNAAKSVFGGLGRFLGLGGKKEEEED